MKTLALILAAVAALLLECTTASAQTAGPSSEKLGSPDYKPSADKPVGWRGDGSGRYVGATPPMRWSRIAKTSIRDLRCQGAKPKGDDTKAAEALPFGRIENWLLIGPFRVEDPAVALDDEIVAKEAELQPAEGDKSGDNAWTAFKAGGDNQHGGGGQSGVEFFRIFGSPTGNVVAYAHTYIYAPAAVKATLRVGMPTAMKIWLNGKVICTEPKAPYASSKVLTIDLEKGWNRLLCKEVSTVKPGTDSVKAWRFVATLGTLDKDFAYETTNVAWMTPLPAASTSLPVIVGDKVFVTSAYADLICINKADGKILWLRTNDYYSAMTDPERAEKPELATQVKPEAEKLATMNEEVVGALNAAVSTTGLSSDKYRVLAEKLSAKNKQEVKINDTLVKLGVTKRPPHIQHVGSANGTPVSDGKHVWAIFGGGIYSGPLVVVCYDLDGKRVWAKGYSDVDSGEHGNHCSPVLADGKLVVQTIKTLRVLDATSGAELWTTKNVGPGDNGGGSPICLKFGGETVIVGPRRDIWRLKDGKNLYTPEANILGHNLGTPVVNDGVLYQITGWGSANYSAFKLPTEAGDSVKPQMLYQKNIDPKAKYKDYTFVDSIVGSPLYDGGLVYYFTEGGVLHVCDAATGDEVYTRMMAELRTRVQWVFWNGACGSPTLAGKNIYLTDDCGMTAIVAPGREFKLLGVNTLENYVGMDQEQTLGTPIFEGKCMYLRSPGYLYCISEK